MQPCSFALFRQALESAGHFVGITSLEASAGPRPMLTGTSRMAMVALTADLLDPYTSTWKIRFVKQLGTRETASHPGRASYEANTSRWAEIAHPIRSHRRVGGFCAARKDGRPDWLRFWISNYGAQSPLGLA